MTSTMTIGKRWVKIQDKRGGHMEWTIEVDKCFVMELLANRCPPTTIQACILIMARSLSPGHDVVCELPCLKTIRNMRMVVLRVTKTLAAYRIGKSPKWTQLHTDKTSRRQISLVNVVVGLLGSDGALRSVCLSGSIIAEDSKPCHNCFVHRVCKATCRLDKGHGWDVSEPWWSNWFDSKAKQHVCIQANEWNGVHRYM